MPYPSSTIPLDYTTPPFPSLYWPIRAPPGAAQYLYSIYDIWRFTLFWTLLTFCLVHSAVAAWAVLMQFHSAMTQRRLLRRDRWQAKSKTRAKSKLSSAHTAAVDRVTTTTTAATATTTSSADDDDVGNVRESDARSASSRTSRAESPLPQPLLVSHSPVLSTLGWVWIIPVVYLTVGALEALLSGSLVGLVAGAVYNAGYFKMSTWMPFLWGIINCLVVILGSFRIQGGL